MQVCVAMTRRQMRLHTYISVSSGARVKYALAPLNARKPVCTNTQTRGHKRTHADRKASHLMPGPSILKTANRASQALEAR